MPKPAFRIHSEGLKIARLLMVLSSISPLFILWAIRGNSLIPDIYFLGFCALGFLLPNAFLWLRICKAKKQQDSRNIKIGGADDHRNHLLVYLFSMLLPLYSQDPGNMRELLAMLAALVLIVFLFWHLNLHYMNLFFAMRGYRVFTVYSPVDGNSITGNTHYVLITRRPGLTAGENLVAYRLSNTVYLEADT
ncbi:hypothetical protein [Thioalkalivibrio sp. HK1]|uniref:hypothetical protein n=1 Tax=Thioalkalivibrio sp. HK1 TaxID=1469245 RepID=UPI00046F6386|nr:hypothetical protein [Thioalkalivibrio sp. HK1]